MKYLMALSVVLMTSLAQATSLLTPMVCTDGTIGQDDYVEIQLLNGTATIQLHETFISLSNKQTVSSGGTLAVVGEEVEYTSEGIDYKSKTNALLIYDSAKHELNATLVMDGATVMAARVLTCK